MGRMRSVESTTTSGESQRDAYGEENRIIPDKNPGIIQLALGTSMQATIPCGGKIPSFAPSRSIIKPCGRIVRTAGVSEKNQAATNC